MIGDNWKVYLYNILVLESDVISTPRQYLNRGKLVYIEY